MNISTIAKLLESTIDNSTGIWRTEKGSVYLNGSTFYRLLNLPNNKVSFKNWMSIIHPEDRDKLSSIIEAHRAKKEEIGRSQYRVQTRDGDYIELESVGLRYIENKEEKWIGQHRVITSPNSYKTRHTETGLKTIHSLSEELCHIISDKEDYIGFIISSERLARKTRKYGTNIHLNFIDFIETSIKSVFKNSWNLYYINDSTFFSLCPIAKYENTLDKLAFSLSESLIVQSELSLSFTREEISLVALEINNITLKLDNLDKTLVNYSRYAHENCINKFLVLSKVNHEAIFRHLTIKDSLLDAIRGDKFTIAVQPIVNLSTGETRSHEVLARWQHPIIGNISPAEFIPLISKQGFTSSFGWMIFRKSCEFLVKETSFNNSININISVDFLTSHNFVEKAKIMADEYNIDTNRIVIELTESVPIDDELKVRQQIYDLKRCGFSLSLDDFGSGYTSLFSIFDLPFDEVKIDKRIIQNIHSSINYIQLIDFLINVSKDRTFRLVAEGVECRTLTSTLRDLGVDCVQGYAICKPFTPS
ncbi:hypothetical protein BIT28_23975 [Photobacterium proteolyticum]|uniref:EAL domain-containing protein n=1 Tax=Photobacterium proteolyticum TaxID=1903952 RepID=A0A1Q9GBS5_9GAMM|nr:EAL domain-containing protein [Photobacterium proteolyticum]OLQ71721.1 hypothetical protein BIT28_23975 [Photobacterium proteolyticum]